MTRDFIGRVSRLERTRRLLSLALAAAGAVCFSSPTALAQATWTGTASGSWSAGANWAGTPPVNSGTSALVFVSATSGSAITATNDLTGLTVSSLTLGSPRDVTLAGNAITLTGGITNTTGSWQYVTLPITLAAGDRAVSTTTGRLYLFGTLSGAAAIVKTNVGDLVLGGTNALTGNGAQLVVNGTVAGSGTFNRALELNAGFGTVFLTSTAALGSASNYVNFVNSANGTLALQTDISMAGYSLSAGSNQGITISVDRATAGAAVTHTLGTLNLGSSSATFNRGGNVSGVATVAFTQLSMSAGNDNSPVTIAGSAQITIGAAFNTSSTNNNRRLQLDGSFNGNTIGTIGDVIPGGPAGVGITSVIKANSSSWILTSSNAYTGSTTINQGTLQLGNGGTTGSIRPTSAITGAAGALLAFNRSDTITQGTDFAPTISGSLGLVKMGAGNLVLSGSNSLGSGVGSQVLLFSNAGSGTVTLRNTAALGAAGNLVRFTGGGSGVLDLQTNTAVNSFDAASGSGQGGAIIVNRATAGAGITHTVGVLDMSSITFNATTGSNVTSGTAGLSVTELRMTGGNDGAPVTLAGNATWAVGSASITNNGISKRLQLDGTAGGNTIGPISNTTNATAGAVVNLIKANSGTWTLTGANTYTGTTTISQGMLQVGSSGTAGSLSPSSAITGAAGATLAFNRSNTVTQGTDFAGVVGGAINLTKLGSGTVILNGVNTYSGTTTITAGVLQVGSGSATGTLGSGPIVNNAALFYNLAGTIVNVPQNVSGTGSLTMSLVSNADNQYIQFNNGTTSLSGPMSFTGNGAAASGFYRGLALSTGTTTLAGTTVSVAGNMGVGGSNGRGFLAIDTSASNGAISLDVSLGRNGSWYLPIGLSANSGTGQLVVSGSNSSGGWNTSGGIGTSLTGGLAISSTIAFTEKTALRATAASAVTGNLTLAGTANAITVDGGAGMNVSGTLGGSGAGFTKLGAGTLTLTGSNTYSGGTTITGGTLQIGNGSTSGAVASSSAISIGSGATLAFRRSDNYGGNFANPISGSGGVTLLSGSLTFSTAKTYTGQTRVSAGVLALGAANTIADQSSLLVDGGGFNLAGSSDTVADVTITSGSIYGAGTLTAAAYGLGGGQVAANLGAGTLNVTANSALDGTSAATAVNLIAGALTLGSSGRFSAAPAVSGSSGASLTLAGNEAFGSLAGAANVALGGNTLSVGSANASTTYSGVLSGSGLVRLLSGSLTLSGSNAYSGGTWIDGGTLTAGHVSAFGTGGITLASGATLDLANLLVANSVTNNGGTIRGGMISGTTTVSGSTTLDTTVAGPVVLTNGASATVGGNVTSAAVFSVVANSSLTAAQGSSFAAGSTISNLGQFIVNGSGTTPIASAISGNGAFLVNGGGKVLLTGSSGGFSGSTMVSGQDTMLAVNGLLGSNVTIDTGAILRGSGAISGALSGQGSVGPGNSPGILAASAFDGTNGLDAAFEITGLAPDYSSPAASVNDVLFLTSGSPFVSSLTSGNVVDIYFDTAAQGTFDAGFFTTQTAENLLTSVQGAAWRFWAKDPLGSQSYNGFNYTSLIGLAGITGAAVTTAGRTVNFGSGNVSGSVTQFVIVPEPGSLALAGLGIGLAGWSLWKRRRRAS